MNANIYKNPQSVGDRDVDQALLTVIMKGEEGA